MQKSLKLKKKTTKKVVMWGKQESWGFDEYVEIDVGTTLVAGGKTLYKGK